MSIQSAEALLQLHIKRLLNFWGFTKAYLRKNNPIKLFLNQTLSTIKEMLSVRQKLKKIQYRINYERYKLKKTELILAQNSEHVFLKGKSLNQTR